MNGSFTTPAAYDVVVDGTLLPGHHTEDAVAALASRFGLPEQTATDLLRGGREVVKKDLDQAKSETYVQALRRCGVVARAERAQRPQHHASGFGESPLAVDYGAAYVPPTPSVRRPPPPSHPSHPSERVEPTPPSSSLTVVGWSFLVAVPLALLMFAFGDALGRLPVLLAAAGIIAAIICNFWLLSVIWLEGGALWAIAAFFFWPANLLFVVTRWHAARVPFLVGLAAGLVWLSGFSSVDFGAVECGSPGSFSYDDGEECLCEDGYDWCGTEDNDMSCCRM